MASAVPVSQREYRIAFPVRNPSHVSQRRPRGARPTGGAGDPDGALGLTDDGTTVLPRQMWNARSSKPEHRGPAATNGLDG